MAKITQRPNFIMNCLLEFLKNFPSTLLLIIVTFKPVSTLSLKINRKGKRNKIMRISITRIGLIKIVDNYRIFDKMTDWSVYHRQYIGFKNKTVFK